MKWQEDGLRVARISVFEAERKYFIQGKAEMEGEPGRERNSF